MFVDRGKGPESATSTSGMHEQPQAILRQGSWNIGEVTAADINRFLKGLDGLGPVSRNSLRRTLVTISPSPSGKEYLHPDRKTAAEQSESFREPETEIAIFTPRRCGTSCLPQMPASCLSSPSAAFSGIRSAEILRLTWEDIKWDRGHIEIAGRKAKTAARRLAILPDNLKAWLAPWRAESVRSSRSPTIGCPQRHRGQGRHPRRMASECPQTLVISYRVAETGDVARTSLEAGNSPKMVFRHYARSWMRTRPRHGFRFMPPKDGNRRNSSGVSARE